LPQPRSLRGSLEESRYSRRDAVNVLQLAFPHCQHTPPVAAQPLKITPIARGIPQSLLLPISGVGLGLNPGVPTGVHVPEASVHVDDLAQSAKHNVRRAGKLAAVQTKAVAEPMNNPPYDQLGFGVVRRKSTLAADGIDAAEARRL
jgi:hypothetical protein